MMPPDPHDPLAPFLGQLAAGRTAGSMTRGLRQRCEQMAWAALALLFPHFSLEERCIPGDPRAELEALRRMVCTLVHDVAPDTDAAEIADGFVHMLPEVHRRLRIDAEALHAFDPAARSVDEVILAYPGFLGIAMHRVAHALQHLGLPLVPRLVAELAHRETGIDIHPGATIGDAFAIDHGTGVVIGETAVIGHRVKLYHGVTLGALSVRKALAGTKRHPTIEDDVVIYSQATILGGDTVIGTGSVIGGNVWLTHSVPPGSVVTNEQMRERPRRSVEPLLEFNI
ncbi:MAG TPA: serine O-acetyltransferase [Gemmatimonadaceae bacterium]|nr:serine O-acetyltransferase [Gemmatimonadaceae bacterium]